MLIQAGRLDRKVTLLRRGPPVDDGRTEVPGEWLPLEVRSASVRPRTGREGLQLGGRAAEEVQSVWLRFDELTRTLTAADSVEIDGRQYEIVAPPIEIGRLEGVELLIALAGPAE